MLIKKHGFKQKRKQFFLCLEEDQRQQHMLEILPS